MTRLQETKHILQFLFLYDLCYTEGLTYSTQPSLPLRATESGLNRARRRGVSWGSKVQLLKLLFLQAHVVLRRRGFKRLSGRSSVMFGRRAIHADSNYGIRRLLGKVTPFNYPVWLSPDRREEGEGQKYWRHPGSFLHNGFEWRTEKRRVDDNEVNTLRASTHLVHGNRRKRTGNSCVQDLTLMTEIPWSSTLTLLYLTNCSY